MVIGGSVVESAHPSSDEAAEGGMGDGAEDGAVDGADEEAGDGDGAGGDGTRHAGLPCALAGIFCPRLCNVRV